MIGFKQVDGCYDNGLRSVCDIMLGVWSARHNPSPTVKRVAPPVSLLLLDILANITLHLQSRPGVEFHESTKGNTHAT